MKYIILIIIGIAIMAVPTLNCGKQMLYDAKLRERDRVAVSYATNTAFWTAYYNGVQEWIAKEAKK